MAALINAAVPPARLVSFTSHSTGAPRRAAVLGLQARATSRHALVASVERPQARKPSAPQELPQAGTATQPNNTAQLLMEREELLRELVEPGRGLAPKASIVSGLRKEIASLRQQLREEIAAAPGTKLDAAPSSSNAVRYNEPANGTSGRSSGSATAAYMAGLRSEYTSLLEVSAQPGVSQEAASRVREALRLVEQRLGGEAAEAPGPYHPHAMVGARSSTGAAWGPQANSSAVQATAGRRRRSNEAALPTTPEQLQLEVLQIENARLRAQAESLLTREAQLRALAQRTLMSSGSDATKGGAATH